jgi:hypothetical protein
MPVVLGIRGGCSAAVGHKVGLREGLQGPIKEEAGGLGVRAPVGIAVVIRAEETDRVTALRDSARERNFWKEGAHGRLADGLVFVYGVERGHVQRRHGGAEQREPA